jgi:hypothetical protein
MAERVAKWAVRLFPRLLGLGLGLGLGSVLLCRARLSRLRLAPGSLRCGLTFMVAYRAKTSHGGAFFRPKQRRVVRQSRVSLTQMAVRCGLLRSDARIGPAPGAWLVILLLGVCIGGSKAQWDELIHTGDCPLSSATGAVSTCLASSWTASSSCCMVSAEK